MVFDPPVRHPPGPRASSSNRNGGGRPGAVGLVQSNWPCQVFSYGTMISACARKGYADEAEEWLLEMWRVVPGTGLLGLPEWVEGMKRKSIHGFQLPIDTTIPGPPGCLETLTGLFWAPDLSPGSTCWRVLVWDSCRCSLKNTHTKKNKI